MMDDDLKVILTILTTGGNMAKVALIIPHGMNDFIDYQYFAEPSIEAGYRENLPPHINDFMDRILAIEEILEVVK